MKISLSRKQELYLIQLGLNSLIENIGVSVPRKAAKRAPWNKGKSGRKWSPQQKAKFIATMKKKWAEKKAK